MHCDAFSGIVSNGLDVCHKIWKYCWMKLHSALKGTIYWLLDEIRNKKDWIDDYQIKLKGVQKLPEKSITEPSTF